MSENLSEVLGETVQLPQDTSEPQEQPQEAPAEAAEQPQEAAEQQPKVVPLAALHEERTRRKELAQQLEAMRQEQARRDAVIEQRLQMLVKQQQPEAPSFDENPAGYLKDRIEQVAQLTEQQVQAQRQAQEAAQQQQVIQQLQTAVVTREQQFAQQTPDYYDAVNFLRTQRANELIALGADPDTAATRANQELMQHAFVSAHQGRNPAELAYQLAKVRGYQAKAVASDAAAKLQSQQKGVSAAKSLGSGGSTNSGAPTLQALLAMSDEDFAAATKGDNWRKIAGG